MDDVFFNRIIRQSPSYHQVMQREFPFVLTHTDRPDIIMIEAEWEKKRQESKSKTPLHKSRWWQDLKIYTNIKSQYGDLLLSTLFSGGTLHCPLDVYTKSLVTKAQDIQNDIIMTDNQIAHNVTGVVAFFEFDHRHATSLPSPSDFRKQFMAARTLVHECYPLADPLMHVCMTTPKIKTKPDGSKILAFGVHLIFPKIVLRTTELKRMCMALDGRIAHETPAWNNIVDDGAVHADSASLRPVWSHKMIPCYVCTALQHEAKCANGRQAKLVPSSGRKRSRNRYMGFGGEYTDIKGDDAALEHSDDDPIEDRLLQCHDCKNGRIIDPSIYRLSFSIDANLQFTAYGSEEGQVAISVHDELVVTSILPLGRPCVFTEGFRPTPDMGEAIDIIPPKNAILLDEKRHANNTKKPTAVSVECQEKIHRLINNSKEEYRFLTSNRISINTLYKMITIDVKGMNSRFCPFNNRCHGSNRIWFQCKLKQRVLSIRCYHPDCCKKGTKCELPIDATVCLWLMKEFGLSKSTVKVMPEPLSRSNSIQEGIKETRARGISIQKELQEQSQTGCSRLATSSLNVAIGAEATN